MAAGKPPIIPFVVLGGGALLTLSAVYDLNPIEAVKNLFTGQNPLAAAYDGGLVGKVGNVTTSGGSAPAGSKRGSGEWVLLGTDAKGNGSKGWAWVNFQTKKQIDDTVKGLNYKGADPTQVARFKGVQASFPKGASSPPMVWSESLGWINPSLYKWDGPSYDPSKTPDSANVPDNPGNPGSHHSGQQAGYTGGSDPSGVHLA